MPIKSSKNFVFSHAYFWGLRAQNLTVEIFRLARPYLSIKKSRRISRQTNYKILLYQIPEIKIRIHMIAANSHKVNVLITEIYHIYNSEILCVTKSSP